MMIDKMQYIIEGEIAEYYFLNVNGTKMRVPKASMRSITDLDDNEMQIINDWIDRNLMPYMTRKSINYDTCRSYGIKHTIEKKIGFYVSNETVKYLLALKGVKGENIHEWNGHYPLNLYYPLSKRWLKDIRKNII